MAKIVTMGEIMLRLSTPNNEKFIQADEFDFDAIFEGADWFHFTGITPAVSDAAAEPTEVALKAAKAHA